MKDSRNILVRLPPRVRIAPSPTGDPHIGTAYIGLFNYVFARKYGGKLILRIDDTDQERSTKSSEMAILEALSWLGLQWDEGPYRQSERRNIYLSHIDDLLKNGNAYRCFCTRERIEDLRNQQIATKQKMVGYDGHCRTIDAEQSAARAAAGDPFTVRLLVPKEGSTSFTDHLRGETITFENYLIDDQVLLKSDGLPTYHLASVVDDHLMEITHVIRGEDWITSTPKHILLYRAFGWEPPFFLHMGLLRNTDRSKLSKRKNPVSIFHYRDTGYMPETLLNFMGTLGYNMGNGCERFTVEDMINHFDWSRMSPGGPIFDPIKLEAFSARDIRALDTDALYQKIITTVLKPDRIKAMIVHAKERISRLDDFIPYMVFAFGTEIDYKTVIDSAKIKGKTKNDVITLLRDFAQEIESDIDARTFSTPALNTFTRKFCQVKGWNTKDLFTLLRIVVTGRTKTPPLFEIMSLCGKDRCRFRIQSFIEQLDKIPDWERV